MWALGVVNHAPLDGAASAVLEQIKIADKDSSSGQDMRIMQSFTYVNKTGQVSKTHRGNAARVSLALLAIASPVARLDKACVFAIACCCSALQVAAL